ncbi:MAG: phage/plasmid primase, P4 family [Syntrophaceae bacterium]
MNPENINKIEKTRNAILKRITALQTVKRKKYVLELARTGEDSLAIRGDEWDKDPMSLGVLNGVIDLRTGELRPGRPDDFMKTIAPTLFQGLYFPAPIWERFISDIFDSDQELIAYIQRLLGYGITGLTNYHIIPIFYGLQGRNGKGTIFETLKIVLGDLIHKTRSEVLLESRYAPARGAADADTLAFRGKRIIWASETEDDRSLNAARIKELVGGDTLNARAPYGKRPIEFSPSHLLILLTNNRPKVPADDDALWDRLHLIPFNVRFVDNPQAPNERPADHNLLEKLKSESSGILAWLIKGCLAWQREGLNPPESVKIATSEYRNDEDEIRQFLADEKIFEMSESVSVGLFHSKYSTWHKENGLTGQPMSMKKISRRLVNMGFRRDDSGRNVVFWAGTNEDKDN